MAKQSLMTGLDMSGNERPIKISCRVTEYDVATDLDVTISAVPCVLLGMMITTVLSAHVVNVLDGTATKISIAASTAAGTKIDCFGAEFRTSLIMNSDDAATGKILIFWRELA